MTFKEFRKKLELLANEYSPNLRQIQALITIYYKNIPIPIITLKESYVVRSSKNDPGEIFKNVKRCSYNPNLESIVIQRCNYPRQQVFYCSMYSDTDYATTSLTCLVETASEYIEANEMSFKIFTLSKWKLDRPLRLWALPFSDLSCEKNRSFEDIRAKAESEIAIKFQNSKEVIKGLKYISDIFCRTENKKMCYHITSSFFNYLLFRQRIKCVPFDGLAYPSANTDGAGVNIALRKELIDDKILSFDVATMYIMGKNKSNAKHLRAEPTSYNALPSLDGALHFIPKSLSTKR